MRQHTILFRFIQLQKYVIILFSKHFVYNPRYLYWFPNQHVIVAQNVQVAVMGATVACPAAATVLNRSAITYTGCAPADVLQDTTLAGIHCAIHVSTFSQQKHFIYFISCSSTAVVYLYCRMIMISIVKNEKKILFNCFRNGMAVGHHLSYFLKTFMKTICVMALVCKLFDLHCDST